MQFGHVRGRTQNTQTKSFSEALRIVLLRMGLLSYLPTRKREVSVSVKPAVCSGAAICIRSKL